MLLRYFFHHKLAHASYLVGCPATGEAVVVDPGRHVDQYLQAAAAEGLRLTAAAETHIHADYVSGSRELAARAGARLYLSAEGGPDWQYHFHHHYPHQLLRDGDLFHVGNLRFEALHTPGHTPEHLSFLITDTRAADRPMGLFSGDFVFVGDVGRPDLLEKAAGRANTAQAAARQMFASLQRFRHWPDYLQVWPAHGAGSACGKALGAVPSTTVGYEKLFNWAFAHDDQDSFVRELLSGQPEPPHYFAVMKRVNREGPALLHGRPLPPPLPFNRLEQALAEGAPVIDTRRAADFAAGHIPGSINIPRVYAFPNWAGWLIDYDRPFYLIVEEGGLEEVAADLSYIGLDNAAGAFDASAVAAWAAPGRQLERYAVTRPADIAAQALSGDVTLLDIRGRSEWDEGRIPGALHVMLGYLSQRLAEIPVEKPIVVLCRSGSRSAIAASLLQAGGRPHVINLIGGMREWQAAGLPVENGQS